MTYPQAAGKNPSSLDTGATRRTSGLRISDRGLVPRARTKQRVYTVAWRQASGDVCFDTVSAPAHPLIESACASLARGALVSTPQGRVAVEDLQPGMAVDTVEFGPLPLKWIGSYDVRPANTFGDDHPQLYRLTADTFGPHKPSHDLLLSARAHILMRHPLMLGTHGCEIAFAPVRAFEDGMSVIPLTPLSTVTVFNMAFDRQATILANGIEIESYHPGIQASNQIDMSMTDALLRLFPHARTLNAFGPPRTHRLSLVEARALRDRG